MERVRLMGDWGAYNLTRVCGWLAQGLWDRSDGAIRSAIHNGRGMGDNLRALSRGEVDIAVVTPSAFARFARDGIGPFEGAGDPSLRALADLPHRDAMIPVARLDLEVRRLSELAAREEPLRVSLGVNDPDGFMGIAGDMLLDAAGLPEELIVARGGIVTRHEQPFDIVHDLRDGRADVMIAEAIMTPAWRELFDGPVIPLTLPEDEAALISARWGLQPVVVPEGYFSATSPETVALSHGGWLVVTRSVLPDRIAELVARTVVEDAERIERPYAHLPSGHSPLAYPLRLADVAATPIELHPAAASVYDKALRSSGP